MLQKKSSQILITFGPPPDSRQIGGPFFRVYIEDYSLEPRHCSVLCVFQILIGVH